MKLILTAGGSSLVLCDQTQIVETSRSCQCHTTEGLSTACNHEHSMVCDPGESSDASFTLNTSILFRELQECLEESMATIEHHQVDNCTRKESDSKEGDRSNPSFAMISDDKSMAVENCDEYVIVTG